MDVCSVSTEHLLIREKILDTCANLQPHRKGNKGFRGTGGTGVKRGERAVGRLGQRKKSFSGRRRV